jgi:hypothetical protein
MHQAACLHVFCYAEPGSGRYVYRRIGSTARPDDVTELWVLLRLGECEQALAARKDHAFGNGADAHHVWAFATHLADATLPDGRRQRFTHLVVTGAPFDARLLEYALLRRYESGVALGRFGNGVLGSTDPEIEGMLHRSAADADQALGTQGSQPFQRATPEASATQPANPEARAVTVTRRPVTLAWHAYAVVFLLSAAGAATSGAAVQMLAGSSLLRIVLARLHL